MFHSIFGGIHLEGKKETTQHKPLSLPEVAPEQVVIPMSMHAGSPCDPTVSVGTSVSLGQPIGYSQDGMTVHASVSGRVIAVEPRPHPDGGRCLSVVIENDDKNTRWTQEAEIHLEFERLSAEQIIERITAAGITGMGGAGFPTGKKLVDAWGKVDTLIVNVAESEPYVTADHRLLLERGESILVGTQILKKAVGARDAVIAIEGNKLNAVEALERKRARRSFDIAVRTVPSRYPLGAEKQIVKSVTGREVPPGGTVKDVGCVVFNIATAFAVYQALVKDCPLTHRVVTVTGGALTRPRNLWVPIGTPMRELVKAAGGFREKASLILTGGPMMGVVLEDLDAPVVKSTNSLICLTESEYQSDGSESVCIRCGRCVSVCPMHLMPLLVQRELGLGGDVSELRRLHTEDCIGCGCCTYICPSNIPLKQRMAEATQRVAQADRQRKEAEQ